MSEERAEIQLTKLESIFVFGIIGCMLFATWELGHIMVHDWFRFWVAKNPFVNRRIILYGIAFFMSITSILVTTKYAFKSGRFGQTVNRAFLWYGTLLLISTIAIFVFDCMPEILAGFIGAGIFVFALYVLQKKYFTKERVIKNRLEKGKCFSCGTPLPPGSFYCPNCGVEVGRKCPKCNSYTRLMDKFCPTCGHLLKNKEDSR
ncbi:zinc ribbon domain-containing protein [bacterium]|nr:zinc ribbon domain-containing protein [bacterium]